jgi:hypothetical protein
MGNLGDHDRVPRKTQPHEAPGAVPRADGGDTQLTIEGPP